MELIILIDQGPDLLKQETLDRRRLERWVFKTYQDTLSHTHIHPDTPMYSVHCTPICTRTPPDNLRNPLRPTQIPLILVIFVVFTLVMIRFKKNHPDHSMCWTRHGEDGFYSVVDAHNHFRWKKQDFPQVNEYNDKEKKYSQ